MKRIIKTAALIMLASCISLYAEDGQSETEAVTSEPPAKTVGSSVGFRLSLLGVEPTASIIAGNLEIEGFVPMTSNSGWDADSSTIFGAAFGGSAGYISNPFRRGWEDGVGVSYLYLTPSYCQATLFRGAFGQISDMENGGHIFSIYYRGTVKFSKVAGLSFKENLPVVMYFPGNKNYSLYSIIDASRLWICWAMLPCSFSAGMRFEF